MTNIWRVGQVVRHALYGLGSVETVLSDGYLRVHFDSVGTTKRLAPDSLLQVSGGPAPLRDPARIPPAPVSPTGDTIAARLALECLRQGVPPPGGLLRWTVGLTAVRDQVGAALSDARRTGNGSIVVVEGGYGQGKSHVGAWARELAASRQMATLAVELDGQGVSLTNSGRLLARMLSSLVLPEAAGTHQVPGLGTLLRVAGPKARRAALPGCEILDPLLRQVDSWVTNEEAIEVVEEYLASELSKASAEYRLAQLGIAISLPALKMNYGTVAERLAAQAAQLARVVSLAGLAGANGALAVIDELDHDLLGPLKARERAMLTLEVWSKKLASTPLVIVLLTPPKLLGHWGGGRRVPLPLLSDKELGDLTAQVVEAYRKVGREIQVGNGVDRLFKRLLADFNSRFRDEGWGPRYFVRAAVEACERATERRVPLESVLG